MPKVIPNLRERLISGAKKVVNERGYSNLTVRQVANDCKIGVGTIYNYFISKENLVVAFMLEDWNKTLRNIEDRIAEDSSAKNIIFTLCREIEGYIEAHRSVFDDEEARKVFSANLEKHEILIKQIAKFVAPVCKEVPGGDREFLAEYISESVLSWVIDGKSYHTFYPIIKLLLVEE